jgi:hypothetical protein
MRQIKVSTQPPEDWILKGVKEQFGVEWGSDIIFTSHGKIRFHSGRIPEDLYNHELTHILQQGDNKEYQDEWWRKYLEDEKFRLSQEIEAYAVQLAWVKRNDRRRILDVLNFSAKVLSSDVYGNLISQEDARKKILDASKNF